MTVLTLYYVNDALAVSYFSSGLEPEVVYMYDPYNNCTRSIICENTFIGTTAFRPLGII